MDFPLLGGPPLPALALGKSQSPTEPLGGEPWSGIGARSAVESCSTSKAARRRRDARTASRTPGRAAPSLST